MKAAIIGLGIIGSEWAKHLEADGILGATWNRSAKNNAPRFESKLGAIADRANILHVVVADPPAVASVLDALLPGLRATHLIIQSSTIDPQSAQKFSQQVRARGAAYLEAPFTGSLPAAQKRELIIYAGGEKETLERARPYLQRLSKTIFHIGSEAQAATLKLSMNLQIASALEALAEALATARRAGISDQCFFEAFRVNASFSGVAALKEQKLRDKEYSPQFSIKHMGKDLRLLQGSLSGEHQLPVLRTLTHLYDTAEQQGLGDLDFSALMKLLQ